ncbi:MAG: hypothetical protein ACK4WD_14030 [Flavobacteriales bacterium]|jgi:hypothetical protein
MLYTIIEMRPRDIQFLKETIINSIYTPIEVNDMMITQALETNFHHAHAKFSMEICNSPVLDHCKNENIGIQLWNKLELYLSSQIPDECEHHQVVDHVVFGLSALMPFGSIHLAVATLITKFIIKKDHSKTHQRLQ